MPQATECVEAHDLTYKGPVDLTRKVSVGAPVKKSALKWAVPYNVEDAAGNPAVTVWRDVVVEEVDLNTVEARIRAEVQQQQKAETQKAVDRALAEDRKKRPAENPRRRSPTTSCPDCPVCDCSGEVDLSTCESVCAAQAQSCPVSDDSYVIRAMLWLESFFPPTMVPAIAACVVIFMGLFMLRFFLTLIFNPAAYRPGYYDNEERERRLQQSVTYYDADGGYGSAMAPPRASLSTSTGNGFLTPHTPSTPNGLSSATSRNGTGPRPSPGGDINDIYRDSIYTPSKGGDGILRRSPYGPGNR